MTNENTADLDSVCYTMNAAEVDCQAALYEIVAVLKNYKANLDTIANALNMYGEE